MQSVLLFFPLLSPPPFIFICAVQQRAEKRSRDRCGYNETAVNGYIATDTGLALFSLASSICTTWLSTGLHADVLCLNSGLFSRVQSSAIACCVLNFFANFFFKKIYPDVRAHFLFSAFFYYYCYYYSYFYMYFLVVYDVRWVARKDGGEKE